MATNVCPYCKSNGKKYELPKGKDNKVEGEVMECLNPDCGKLWHTYIAETIASIRASRQSA